MAEVGKKRCCGLAESEVQLGGMQQDKEKISINRSPQHSHHPISKRSPALPTILGIAVLVFALDQTTKILVVQNIPLHGSWSFFPALARIFQFTFITNTGAAFGMFPQLGGTFMAIAVIVIVSIVIFYRHLPVGNIWVRISLGLQLGGALGNLLDRITRGFVVDFVDIGFWPIFNMADLSIVLGVTLLAYHLWNEENSLDRVENVPNRPKEAMYE